MSKKVQGFGPAKARIMAIGEAPGRNEEIEGKPFVGAAGNVARQAMLAAGINPNDVYWTNVCKYRPPENEIFKFFDKNGVPNDLVLEGMMELREEIEAVDPTVIILFGNYPLWAVGRKARWKRGTGYVGITDWRGSIIEGHRAIAPGRKCVVANHPAALLRQYSLLSVFDLDLKRAREQSLYPEIRRPERTLITDPQGEDREYWRDRLLGGDETELLTFDIEQTGSDLLCIGFTRRSDEAVTIRTRTASDIQWCRDILLSGRGLCAQNGIFDCSMLEYWHRFPGLIRNLRHDTMLASHAAYIELPKDLGFLCSIYTEQPCYWGNIDWNAVRADNSRADSIDFLTYNAIDTWVTHDVMQQQAADELQDPAVKATFEFEMSLLEPLWKMSLKGMNVSQERMKTLRAQCEVAIKENSEKLTILAGRDINVMSRDQVAKLLFDELGLHPVRLTETGKPSTDDKVLAELEIQAEGDSPAEKLRWAGVRYVRDIRENRALISKFTDIEFDPDGRMRCHYKPAGTTTGRLSSAKFFPTGRGANLQNIPRDQRVRSVFTADKGKLFFYNDLERAESLVVAKLTGDPLMLAHHAEGADAHRLLAVEFFKKPAEEVTKDERYIMKQTRHAGNYMEGWRTFQINVNKEAKETGLTITAAEAKKFIAFYRSRHPYLTAWWNDIRSQLDKTRTLYNLAPHRRPRKFYDRLDSILPTAVAYTPQSTVGDVLNIALLRCDRDEELTAYGCDLLVQVHDAIGGQCDEKYIEPCMRRFAELMKVDLTVPKTGEVFHIPVEIAFGPSWGEVKKWEVA